MWFQLAMRLGKTLQEVMDGTTATEFVKWVRFLEMEPNLFNPSHYYMAQLAAIIVKMNGAKNARNVKIDDFILKFNTEPKAQESQTDKMNRSKQAWLSAVGIKERSHI